MSFYNSEETEAIEGFEALAPGRHTFEVVDVSARETKAKQEGRSSKGMMFVVKTKEILTGAPITLFYNVENENPKAQQIGRGTFKSLHESLGTPVLSIDTDDDLLVLVGKRFSAESFHEAGDDGKTYSRIKIHSIKQVGAGAHGVSPSNSLGQAKPSQPNAF